MRGSEHRSIFSSNPGFETSHEGRSEDPAMEMMIRTAPRRHDVVNHECHRVKVRQRVVDVLATDSARWLRPADSAAVLVGLWHRHLTTKTRKRAA